jgi:hypothetical protein
VFSWLSDNPESFMATMNSWTDRRMKPEAHARKALSNARLAVMLAPSPDQGRAFRDGGRQPSGESS